MSEKSKLQKILDTKIFVYKLPSFREYNRYFKYLFAFFIFGTFTFLTRDQIRLINGNNILTSNAAEVKSYNCSDYHRLIEQKRFAEAEELYPDTTTFWNIIAVSGAVLTHNNRPLLNCLEASDPRVLKAIKETIKPPSLRSEPYHLDDLDSVNLRSRPQTLDVMEMVFKDNLTHGFFVEAGAADCEWSMTLPLEARYKWKGLLVEMLPDYYNACIQVNRKSWLLHSCLGMKESPQFIDFDFSRSGNFGENNEWHAMAGFAGPDASQQTCKVQCYPVYSMLMALNNPKVNLFVLDIEGYELAILRTIPWKKVDIEVISLEIDLAGKMMKDSSPEIITRFLVDKGYTRFNHRNNYNYRTGMNQDALFVRNDIVQKYNVVQL